MTGCACPQHAGRRIVDLERHTAWHELVIEQGGPADVVDAVSLRDARGMTALTIPTQPDGNDRPDAPARRRSPHAGELEARAWENATRAATDGHARDRQEREIYR